MFFFFFEFLPQCKLDLFFLSYLLACLTCFVWLGGPTPYFRHYPHSCHQCLLPPTSTVATCSHLFAPTYFRHHYLLPPTCSCLHYNKGCPCMPSDFTAFWVYSLFSEHGTNELHPHFIVVLLSPSSPVPISHMRLLTSSPTFAITTFFRLLLPTSLPIFAITTFFHLFSPMSPILTYFHHCNLLVIPIATYSHLLHHCHMHVFAIATYMFSPSPPTPAYFHHYRPFRYLTYFYLLRCLLAYPCYWHVWGSNLPPLLGISSPLYLCRRWIIGGMVATSNLVIFFKKIFLLLVWHFFWCN
jgi:hypothetical protein